MYIAIEGVKGSGKSTLLAQLTEKLQQQNIQFVSFNPTRPMPMQTWWEQSYAQWAHDDSFISALYSARANYHAQATDFQQDLVLGDRSILTSMVTRWQQNRHRLGSYIRQVQMQEQAVPVPDVVLYLDVSLNVVQQRLAQRERHYGLQDETLLRLQQTQQAYRQIFRQKQRFGLHNMQVEVFDANQNSAELLQAVEQYIQSVCVAV
ncbi:MAG TPA: deoxynucleoside kinase [Acinetobacter sp.]|jgi:thymidylate kinase|nr:deoxynucleoside kinase [Acinetobacter sp.]